LNFSVATGATVANCADDRRFTLRRIFGSHALVSLVILCALTACTTQQPRSHTSKPPTRNPDRVSVAPASGVAVLNPGSYEQDKLRIKAALANNERDSLAPSEVGYYLDVLQGRLKQVAGQGMSVARQGDRIVLAVSIRAGFESGGSKVSPALREILMPLSKALLEYRKTFVSVRIRPEDAGTPTSNPRLAEQRALAVARWLVDSGITGKRVAIVGTDVRTDQTAVIKAGPENPVSIELQIEPVVRVATGKR